MNQNHNKIRLDDLLDALADEWPETDDEIKAAINQPAEPYSDAEGATMVARILGADSPAHNAPGRADADNSAGATLFDHLDAISVSTRVDVHSSTGRYSGEARAPIIDLYDLVTEAYVTVRNQMPVDFVVLDPSHNAWFISECRRLNAAVSEFHLNKALLNVRKAGRLRQLPPSLPSPVSTAEMDQYAHGSEMALRLVQEHWFHRNHENVALDRILSDPRLRERFDRYAARIAKHDYGVLALRWAALAHRKAGRSVRVDRELSLTMFDQLGKMKDVRIRRIPESPGIYLCRTTKHDAYVGTTDNLRKRVGRHLEAGPNLVPEELGFNVAKDCSIGIIEMPLSASKRNGLVSRFKNKRMPLLNFLGLLPYAA